MTHECVLYYLKRTIADLEAEEFVLRERIAAYRVVIVYEEEQERRRASRAGEEGQS